MNNKIKFWVKLYDSVEQISNDYVDEVLSWAKET